MSTSPFMTPSHRRRRREASLRRRRRRRAIFAGALALVLVAAVVVVALARPGATHGSASATARHHPKMPSSAAALSRPRSSAIGLPLGTAPLTLTGIGTQGGQDPIKLAFHEPPRAGLLFNLDTGQVLWQRNPSTRLRIASLTKMMTALVTVSSSPPNASVLITKQAVDQSGSKVGVLPLGKHVRLETLLYGLLLPSGNDAAVALAQYVAGSVSAFVARMNAEAAKLGMGCTRYSSPSGYFDQGNYSCATDLAVLARVVLAQPRLARIVHTFSAALPFPIKGGKLYLYNNNPLLRYAYPGVTGLKTGWTVQAGDCLVASAERHGVRLGVVLLHSTGLATQASQLLNRGFEDVYHQAPVPQQPIPPGA
jgi:serine-type D-Ala-D-Ala carboxypeptidase (penicillin-binding protein 5/6)